MPSKFSPHGGKGRPLKCRECGKQRADGHYISKRGLCERCSIVRQVEPAEQMANGAGPYFDRWRQSMIDLADELERSQ